MNSYLIANTGVIFYEKLINKQLKTQQASKFNNL